MTTALRKSHSLAREHLEDTEPEQRKALGQYFTPPIIAEFMAGHVCPRVTGHVNILDPGAGTGTLGIAAARKLLSNGMTSVHVTAFENDTLVLDRLTSALLSAAAEANGRLTFNVLARDFLEGTQGSLFDCEVRRFDVVIANPPYFKTSPSAEGGGEPNAYASFMRRSAELLTDGGHLVFIVPRSFASGFYFRRFRRFLREQLELESLHVFDSRKSAFKDQSVLQENIIVVYRKEHSGRATVNVTSSHGTEDLAGPVLVHVPRNLMYAGVNEDAVLRIPITLEDVALLRRFESFSCRLEDLNLAISTGPVVPFRAGNYLRSSANEETVPLLWLQHVTPEGVRWPVEGFRKPQAITCMAPQKLRVPNQTCVLLRRFSAKEDDRRLVAGVLRHGQFSAPWIGIENHVNLIYRPGGQMTLREAEGLSRVLNSRGYDDYFRICNGNTQVGATEIRELPLPPMRTILELEDPSARLTRARTEIGELLFT